MQSLPMDDGFVVRTDDYFVNDILREHADSRAKALAKLLKPRTYRPRTCNPYRERQSRSHHYPPSDVMPTPDPKRRERDLERLRQIEELQRQHALECAKKQRREKRFKAWEYRQ